MTKRLSFLGQTPVVVVVALIIGALLGTAAAFLPGKTYKASVIVYIAPPISSSPTDALMADEYASNRAQLYLALITSEPLLSAVAAMIDTPGPPSSLADSVRATALHQTSLIQIDVTSSSPDSAVTIAQAFGVALPDFAKNVEAKSGVREGPTVGVVTHPDQIRAEPDGMKPVSLIAIFGIACSALGLVISLRYRRKHPLVRAPADIRNVTASPFVESVDLNRGSADLERAQALLLASPRLAPLLFVAPNSTDRCAEFAEALVESAAVRRMSVRLSSLLDADVVNLDDGNYTFFVAPAVLEDSRQASLLSSRPFETILVCRRGRTPVRSILDVTAILEANGIPIAGTFIVKGSFRKSPKDAELTDDGAASTVGAAPAR